MDRTLVLGQQQLIRLQRLPMLRSYSNCRMSQWTTSLRRRSFASQTAFSQFSNATTEYSLKRDAHCNLYVRCYTSTTAALQNKDYPAHTLYPMPALSPTMELGTITSWSKQPGEEFTAGDVLCTIETDKASVDFEAQDDGILAKILRQGATAVDLAIGTPICVVVNDAADVAAFADFELETTTTANSSSSSSATTEADSTASSTTPTATSTTGVSGTSILLPSARHLAESKGLDATVLSGSGKGGRVTKGDVLQAIDAGTMPPLTAHKSTAAATSAAASPGPVTESVTTEQSKSTVGATTAGAATPSTTALPFVNVPVIETDGSFNDVANNKMRKIIAKRLTESKSQVPHFYTSMEVELDKIMSLRKQLANQHDIKVSVNDFVIRCCALSLRDVPEVNATYHAPTDSVQMQDSIDISVAVATPTGLITPIVFNTDKLGLAEITSTVKDLAVRARDGKLAPHEYQGGSFSVSNLGMFGIDEFSAVINPPQAAILAVGGGSRRVVPTPYKYDDDDDKDKSSSPSIKTIMTARLSADRRVVDEATAALFVSAFRHYVNQPELLLL